MKIRRTHPEVLKEVWEEYRLAYKEWPHIGDVNPLRLWDYAQKIVYRNMVKMSIDVQKFIKGESNGQ